MLLRNGTFSLVCVATKVRIATRRQCFDRDVQEQASYRAYMVKCGNVELPLGKWKNLLKSKCVLVARAAVNLEFGCHLGHECVGENVLAKFLFIALGMPSLRQSRSQLLSSRHRMAPQTL